LSDPWRLSASRAPLLLPPNCPRLFKEAIDTPVESTPAMEFGQLVHTLLLGVGEEYEVLDPAVHGRKRDGTVSDNPKACAAWKAAEKEVRDRGALVFTPAEYEQAAAMVAAVRSHPLAGPLFEQGKPEVPLEFVDPDTGVLLTGRVDWITFEGDRLVLADLKTSSTAEYRAFSRKAFDLGYHIAGAWYHALARLMGLALDPIVRFVAVEKASPYLVSVINQRGDELLLGATRMRQAINLYHQCRVTDQWPGYDQMYDMTLPPWAFR